MKKIYVHEYGPLVHIGRNLDGGYVLPQIAVERADLLLSFGISNEWSFETDFLSQNQKVRLHGFDGSINHWYFLKKAMGSYLSAATHRLAFQTKRFERSLGVARKRSELARQYRTFFRGRAKHHSLFIQGSTSAQAGLTIADVLTLSQATSADRITLKIDIEGTEYDIIADIAAIASQIDCLVIEFHETEKRAEEFERALEQLAAHFVLVHAHGNNIAPVAADGIPHAVELTFLAHKLVDSGPRGEARQNPSRLNPPRLDYPNNPDMPDFPPTWIEAAR